MRMASEDVNVITPDESFCDDEDVEDFDDYE
jgi:hypothetical protein